MRPAAKAAARSAAALSSAARTAETPPEEGPLAEEGAALKDEEEAPSSEAAGPGRGLSTGAASASCGSKRRGGVGTRVVSSAHTRGLAPSLPSSGEEKEERSSRQLEASNTSLRSAVSLNPAVQPDVAAACGGALRGGTL